MAMIQCPECHESVSNQALSCPKCGFPINQQAAATAVAISVPKKSKSLAVFLALILGGIGAHKFYVDKPGVGLVYLIFCWTFIPAIIGFFEALQYLSMKEDVFQERYLKKTL